MKQPSRDKRNNFLYASATILVPSLFVITSIFTTYFIHRSYQETENDLIERESQIATFELAENLKRSLAENIRILEIVAQARPDIFPYNKKHFLNNMRVITKHHPDFFAINWIDPDGYIRWVYPEIPNKSVRDVQITERTEITDYIYAARDMKKTTISHVIDLYQGPKGLIIYVPIFDGSIFKGWYNGVLDIDKMLDRFFDARKFQNIFVNIRWKGHDNYIYGYGDRFDKVSELEFESQILNQTLIVEADLMRGPALQLRKSRLSKIFTIIYVSIFLIAIFLFYIIRTQFVFMSLTKRLTRDKTLLNILSHDMATPLTLISENVKRLKDKLKDQNFLEVDRITRSSEKLKDLLTKVRSFHATNMGKIKIELLPVSASDLIEEALALYEDQLKEKEISYNIEMPHGTLYCLTDRMTAVHNVLGNVLSNSIKFSNKNTKINVRSYKEGKWVVVEVQDQGTGISKDTLLHLFDERHVTSTKGTKGELGTGLGMLQIKTFMEFYKGSVEIESTPSGTTVRLYFRATKI